MIIKMISILICLLFITIVQGQRPSFAGSLQHSGYKDKFKPESNITIPTGFSERFEEDLLSNKTQRPPVFINVVSPDPVFSPVLGEGFGNNSTSSLTNRLPTNPNQFQFINNAESTTRLPYDALGNKDIVDRLNRLPIDQRPFWLINAEAIEKHRNQSQSQSGNATVNPQPIGSFSGNRNPIVLESLVNFENETSTEVFQLQQNDESLLENVATENINFENETFTDASQLQQTDDSLQNRVFNDNTSLENETTTDANQVQQNDEPLQESVGSNITNSDFQNSSFEAVEVESLIDIVDNEAKQEPIEEEESETTLQPDIIAANTIPPNSAGFPNYGRIRS